MFEFSEKEMSEIKSTFKPLQFYKVTETLKSSYDFFSNQIKFQNEIRDTIFIIN